MALTSFVVLAVILNTLVGAFRENVTLNSAFSKSCPVKAEHQITWDVTLANKTIIQGGFCDPLPSPCWEKNSNYINISRSSATTSELTIRNVTMDFHVSTLTCSTFYQSELQQRYSVNLDVIHAPRDFNFTVDGQITSNLTLNASSSRSVQLDCSANGYPVPELNLTYDDEPMRRQQRRPRSSTGPSITKSVSAICANAGSYECQATNKAGQQSATIVLNILCQPTTTLFHEHGRPEVSKERHMPLSVEANPPPDIFRFVYFQNSSETPVDDNQFAVTCQANSMSLQVCTVALVFLDDSYGNYGVYIRNAMGEDFFRFWVAYQYNEGTTAETKLPDRTTAETTLPDRTTAETKLPDQNILSDTSQMSKTLTITLPIIGLLAVAFAGLLVYICKIRKKQPEPTGGDPFNATRSGGSSSAVTTSAVTGSSAALDCAAENSQGAYPPAHLSHNNIYEPVTKDDSFKGINSASNSSETLRKGSAGEPSDATRSEGPSSAVTITTSLETSKALDSQKTRPTAKLPVSQAEPAQPAPNEASEPQHNVEHRPLSSHLQVCNGSGDCS